LFRKEIAIEESFVSARRRSAWGFGGAILAAVGSLLVSGCALPALAGRPVTSALPVTDTTLGRALAPSLAAHAGKAGIRPLSSPQEAFAARGVLAAAAEHSLDVQYYIWHGDETGYLLFEALWQAAERGVRVRLLLDDINTKGLDATLAALDAHPNIEVRLYNPFTHRSARWTSYLTDFKRINRRMHNKSFTVDNQVTIVGGRNIGNEYFAAGSGVAFADLDVIAIGPVVREVSAAFDRYWNSASAYPVAGFLPEATAETAEQLQTKFAATRADAQSVQYLAALRETPLAMELRTGHLTLDWADTVLVCDDPAKTLDAANDPRALMLSQLLAATGRPMSQFDLVSPYFVPKEEGVRALSSLVGTGVKVRVLTNSLGANDVSIVHAGYAKRRKALLRSGVQLYELEQQAAGKRAEGSKVGGSSSASLHAKTFQIDGQRVFVGSFNFDPRSATLNTEIGLLIDSPSLAKQLEAAFDTGLSSVAYEVRLNEAGELRWIEHTPTGVLTLQTEPQTNAFGRAVIRMLSIFPIDWLL
jgi:putative cardiolipin synthase